MDCGSTSSVAEHLTTSNVFRDTPLRYLGYCNEVGESFRFQYPRLVVPSYIISFSYCFADAATMGWSVYHQQKKRRLESPTATAYTGTPFSTAIIATCDTLVWQCLASVLIPGGVINLLVRGTKAAMGQIMVSTNNATNPRAAMLLRWGPTLVGLGSIPWIVHPIDTSVDYVMDTTLRPYYFNVDERSK